MKVAIVGCGGIAVHHAIALQELGHEIVLCIDKDISIAKAFSDKWGNGEATTNLEAVKDGNIDSVHICTPPNLHYDQVKLCLNLGKHVICEKPLCLDDNEAKELEQLACEKQLVTAVGFNIRHHIACQKMAEIVKDESFGQTYLIHGSYLQEYNAFPAPFDWRYNPLLAGKMRAVTEIGSHWFDLAEFVTGQKIVAVSASFGNFYPKRYELEGVMKRNKTEGSNEIVISSEDAASISLKFENRAIGTVVLSEVSHGRINRLSLEVTGENRTVWWNSEDNNILHTGRKNHGINTEIMAFGNGFSDTLKSLLRNVYLDISNGKPEKKSDYPTFLDGYRNVRLCNAVYQSAKSTSKWIKVEV